MSKNFATFAFMNPFTLAAEVTWGLHNLSRGWQHIKLHIHFQPALPCYAENRWASPFFMASSKAIVLILVFSPKNFLSVIRQ
jgi:hypothetical protein